MTISNLLEYHSALFFFWEPVRLPMHLSAPLPPIEMLKSAMPAAPQLHLNAGEEGERLEVAFLAH